MRTTINIDDEVYIIAKHLAQTNNHSIGDTISELVRKGLDRELPKFEAEDFPIIPTRNTGKKITNEFINKIREEEGF